MVGVPMFIGVIWATCVCGQVIINQLNPSGVLFEPISPAFVYQANWNIFTKIPWVNEEEVLSFILNCEEAAEKLCNIQSQDNKFCQHWLVEIQHVVSKVDKQLNSISYYLRDNREKRELVDAVGKLSKYLFGTMDSEDAKDIYSRLKNLEEHDRDSIHLINKQVTIMKTSFEAFNKNFQNLSHYQEQIEEKMNEFSSKVNSEISKINLELQGVHLQAELNQLFIYLITALQSINRHLTESFSIINSLQQHRLHPLIISPKVLLETYAEITKEAHISLIDFHLLNQIIEVYSIQDNGELLIRIKIPVLEEEKYLLNRIHLFPITNEDHSAILDLEVSIVLNSTQEEQYIALTNEEFHENCLKCNSKLNPTMYICAQKQLKSIGVQRENCLFNLLYNSSSITQTCSYRILQTGLEFLVKLARKNSWLFSLQKSRSLLAHCEKATTHKEINGTGILSLNQPCKYTMETLVIPYEGYNEIKIPFQQPQSPTINKEILKNVANRSTLLNKPNNIQKAALPLFTSHHNYNNILKSSSKALDELGIEIAELEKERKLEHQRTQTHINSGGLTLLVVLVIIFSAILLRRSCRKKPVHNVYLKPSVKNNQGLDTDLNPTPPRGLVSPTPPEVLANVPLPNEVTAVNNEATHVTQDVTTKPKVSILTPVPMPPTQPADTSNETRASDVKSIIQNLNKSFRIKI